LKIPSGQRRAPAPVQADIGHLSDEAAPPSVPPRLPARLDHALDALEDDPILHDALGRVIVGHYVPVKRFGWACSACRRTPPRSARARPAPHGSWPRSPVGRWSPCPSRRARPWFLLLDTYRERGFSRYEPQPADLVRRGLVRRDGRDGGVLLVVPREHLGAATSAVEGLGLELRMWGNGSPEPEGWTWALGR
jgi:hypothetical protein